VCFIFIVGSSEVLLAVKPATFETLNALRDAGVGGTGTGGKKGGGAADGAATNSLFRENCSPERR
jgi:hypothetical protein